MHVMLVYSVVRKVRTCRQCGTLEEAAMGALHCIERAEVDEHYTPQSNYKPLCNCALFQGQTDVLETRIGNRLHFAW